MACTISFSIDTYIIAVEQRRVTLVSISADYFTH